MPTLIGSELSQFAQDVAAGFSKASGKRIAPRYFYDDLGSTLFEAITLLPEYGLTRADDRLLRLYADDIAQKIGRLTRQRKRQKDTIDFKLSRAGKFAGSLPSY